MAITFRTDMDIILTMILLLEYTLSVILVPQAIWMVLYLGGTKLYSFPKEVNNSLSQQEKMACVNLLLRHQLNWLWMFFFCNCWDDFVGIYETITVYYSFQSWWQNIYLAVLRLGKYSVTINFHFKDILLTIVYINNN